MHDVRVWAYSRQRAVSASPSGSGALLGGIVGKQHNGLVTATVTPTHSWLSLLIKDKACCAGVLIATIVLLPGLSAVYPLTKTIRPFTAPGRDLVR